MSNTSLQLSDEQLGILKNTIKDIIYGILKDYILIPKNKYFIDEQGFKYIYTENSFTPLKKNFQEELQSAQMEIENGEFVEHKEFWKDLGI